MAYLQRVAFLIGVVALAACASGGSEPGELGEGVSAGRVAAGALELHYVEAGRPGQPLVVFLHGTPGSWRAFRTFIYDARLAASTHMIAVDRLGWGRSAASGARPSFADQAAAISRVFARNRSPAKITIVGHSLGGSLGARLVADFPDDVGALLAISAGLSPELGAPRWYNRLAAAPLLGRLVPASLARANEEVMVLRNELAALEPRLADLEFRAKVIQGGEDWLVDPRNAGYAERTWRAAELEVIRYPDAGHFFIWEQPSLVVEQILELTAGLAQ